MPRSMADRWKVSREYLHESWFSVSRDNFYCERVTMVSWENSINSHSCRSIPAHSCVGGHFWIMQISKHNRIAGEDANYVYFLVSCKPCRSVIRRHWKIVELVCNFPPVESRDIPHGEFDRKSKCNPHSANNHKKFNEEENVSVVSRIFYSRWKPISISWRRTYAARVRITNFVNDSKKLFTVKYDDLNGSKRYINQREQTSSCRFPTYRITTVFRCRKTTKYE